MSDDKILNPNHVRIYKKKMFLNKVISIKDRNYIVVDRENLARHNGAKVGNGAQISLCTLRYLQKYYGNAHWDITIKENSSIFHLVHIRPGVFIGEGAAVYGPEAARWNYLEEEYQKIENTSKHLLLKRNVYIGKNSTIKSSDNKIIGKNVFIDENVDIESAVEAIGDDTVIGKNVKLYARSVGRNCVINRVKVICSDGYNSQRVKGYKFDGLRIPDGVKVYERVVIDFSMQANQHNTGFKEIKYSEINNDGLLEQLFTIPNLVIMSHTTIDWDKFNQIIEKAKSKKPDEYLVVKNEKLYITKLQKELPAKTQKPGEFLKKNRFKAKKKTLNLAQALRSFSRYIESVLRGDQVHYFIPFRAEQKIKESPIKSLRVRSKNRLNSVWRKNRLANHSPR